MYTKESEYLKKAQELKISLNSKDYQNYISDYYLSFARYLVLLCSEEYYKYVQVEELNYEEAINILKLSKCKKSIKSILIGEAPPTVQMNYFYNPSSPWNGISGRPGPRQSFTISIFNALFSGLSFSSKREFLEECARTGFLLLDLFPFAINYLGIRKKRAYSEMCIAQFASEIIPFLQSHVCCLDEQKTIGIAFAFKTSGEIILGDSVAVSAFNTFQSSNGISLDPGLPIDVLRTTTVANASRFLRVCLTRYSYVPNSSLLNISGIR